MITASIICDSVNPLGVRLTTFELTYPRFIHPEFMTHRALSRNAASSRAIPIEKMMDRVYQVTAVPEFWAKNQRGMQAAEELQGEYRRAAILEWHAARDSALGYAKRLRDLDLHKAIVNRVLEPFSPITVVCTATDYTNFFALRAHPMAQQEFQVLAYRMLGAYLKSNPVTLLHGQWHLPYIFPEDRDLRGVPLPERDRYDSMLLAKISAARCARVSYLTQDGVRDPSRDLELYERLVAQVPLHASALEHPAMADVYGNPARLSNFDPSWKQLRKFHPQENVTHLDLDAVLAGKPDWITL